MLGSASTFVIAPVRILAMVEIMKKGFLGLANAKILAMGRVQESMMVLMMATARVTCDGLDAGVCKEFWDGSCDGSEKEYE